MSNKDKAIGKALRLKRLANQGVGGERDAAKKALERLMRYEGITHADLDDDGLKPAVVHFSVRTKQEQRLLIQILSMVLNVGDFPGHVSKGKFFVELTPLQQAEVETTFSHYKREWKDLTERAFKAFVSRHQIGIRANPEEYQDLTNDQILEVMRTAELASKLGTSQYNHRKQIRA